MKSIISPAGIFGGFTSITELSDRYVTDSCEYPFNAIGEPHSIGEWIPPIVVPVIIVPTPVSRRQIRMALSRTTYGAGTLRTAVESAIAASNQDTKDWYEQSVEFHRSNPITIAMGIGLGVSPAQLDALWILANTL